MDQSDVLHLEDGLHFVGFADRVQFGHAFLQLFGELDVLVLDLLYPGGLDLLLDAG